MQMWHKAKIIDGYTFLSDASQTPNSLRLSQNICPLLPLRGGWHMSYFGGVNFITNKIESFSHQEYNNEKIKDPKTILKAISSGADLYGREAEKLEEISIGTNPYLPYYHKLLGVSQDSPQKRFPSPNER